MTVTEALLVGTGETDPYSLHVYSYDLDHGGADPEVSFHDHTVNIRNSCGNSSWQP